MAQFRTTADYVDAVLNRAGETTSGTSSYESDALTYLNKIHHGLVAGGLVFDVEIDDDWTWARAKYPYVIELQAPIETGTVTFTNGSDGITFTSGPAASVVGWHIRIVGEKTVYRIASHTAAATAADIDGFYTGTTGSKSYVLFKIDYEVAPSHIYIESGINDKLDFIRTGSTEATASLTPGAYTPAALATHVATQVATAAGGSSVYGASFDAVTGKFTLTSDTASTDVFKFLCATGTNVARSAWPTLGFDYTDDSASADSHTSTYVLGGVSRLVAPIRAYRNGVRSYDIKSLDIRAFQEDCPLGEVPERVPRFFTVLREQPDGRVTVRLDSFPAEEMKIEVDVIEVPLDLKDNAASIPRVPRKYSDILEYGAAHFILVDKADDKAASYAQFAQAQLRLMQRAHRAQADRTDPDYGQFIARPELRNTRRRLRYGYDASEG